MRIKKISIRDYKLIQYQILQTNLTRTEWQTVRRITEEILGVNGLNRQTTIKQAPIPQTPKIQSVNISISSCTLYDKINSPFGHHMALFSGTYNEKTTSISL